MWLEILVFLKSYGILAIPSFVLLALFIIWLTIAVFPTIYRIFTNFYCGWRKFVKLLSISDQFENNGGSSLRDKIDAILNECKVLNGKINAFMAFDGKPCFETCEQGEYNMVTPSWCELTGLIPDEAMGYGWVNSVCEADKERVIKEWNSAIAHEREFHLEYTISNLKTGKKIKVKGNTIVVRDGDNKPVKYIGMLVPNVKTAQAQI